MNPPDHNPKNLPQQVHGEASGRRPGTDPVRAPKPEVSPNRLEKPKAQTLGDLIFKIYFAKTTAEAQKLGKLNLPQSALERAARILACKKTKKRLIEAFKYAVNSAKSETITDAEILTELLPELLPELGMTTMKLCPKEPKKQGSRVRKEKGGNHGA